MSILFMIMLLPVAQGN